MLMMGSLHFKQNISNPDGGGDGGANPPASTPPPVDTPPANPGGPQTLDWNTVKGAISEELRDDPSLSPIESIDGLVKSYIHAQKAFGKDRVAVPDKHATKDDWVNLFRQLGSPEKLEEYELSIDKEVDDNFKSVFKEQAHKAGLLPWQAEEMLGFLVDNAQKDFQSSDETFKAKQDEDVKLLRAEWGEAYDDNVKRAEYALKEFLPNEEDRRAFIEAGHGGDVRMVKLLANASKLMTEDQFLGHGDGKFSRISPTEALQQARTIQGDSNHPYRNPTHPNHEAAKQEVANLYKIAYPE